MLKIQQDDSVLLFFERAVKTIFIILMPNC
jgi:hypothetical protein